MLTQLHKRTRKVGLPPESMLYTGEQKIAEPYLSVVTYDNKECAYLAEATLDQSLFSRKEEQTTWVSVIGLQNVDLIKQVGTNFNIHPLVIEDILNIDQRPKVEEYDNYLFITLKMLNWNNEKHIFTTEQVSLIVGQGFLLSFQEEEIPLFGQIRQRLTRGQARLREHGSDYLAYSLLDAITDQYFVVLEGIGEHIEKVEKTIIAHPSSKDAQYLYHLKQQMFLLRKTVWPLRELINHLLHVDTKLISSFTTVYLRDVYDHTVHVIDTIETYRDMLAGLLDVYLSSLTNRMNEVMKVLTIIATIFIPLTFITSIYGMNFEYMPELHWRWSYPTILMIMLGIGIGMVIYFKRKKWW